MKDLQILRNFHQANLPFLSRFPQKITLLAFEDVFVLARGYKNLNITLILRINFSSR